MTQQALCDPPDAESNKCRLTRASRGRNHWADQHPHHRGKTLKWIIGTDQWIRCFFTEHNIYSPDWCQFVPGPNVAKPAIQVPGQLAYGNQARSSCCCCVHNHLRSDGERRSSAINHSCSVLSVPSSRNVQWVECLGWVSKYEHKRALHLPIIRYV